MDKEKAADQYVESVIIDLSKQLTAAEKRIEALEAALQPFVDPCIEHCFEQCESECDPMAECPCFIARAALGEKKDG